MSFDTLGHLNPALRNFYASGNNLPSTNAESSRSKYPAEHVEMGCSENQNSSYVFGESKFKELLNSHDTMYTDCDTDDYYPQECNELARNCNYLAGHAQRAAYPPAEPIDEELVRQQLLLLSTRADEELMYRHDLRHDIYGRKQNIEKQTSRFDRQPEKKIQRGPSNVSMLVQEHLEGFGEKREVPQEDQNRKRRLCRHFLKGHCKRGKACDFLHDSSIFCPDLQKVFLGGLPAHITESTLREKLADQGFTVINRPKVLRGFTPQVCLGSVNEAQRLIEKGKINIDGSLVDVRPYEAFAKDNLEKKLPDDIKRSVFLGGLVTGTTGQRIKDDLEKMDVRVVNHPIIKTGFSPMVTVGTVEQAQLLVKLKKVLLNDALVDVRPYVDFRKRY